jgi:NAD+ kinase
MATLQERSGMNIAVIHKIPKLERLRDSSPDRLKSIRSGAPELFRSLQSGAERQWASIHSVVEVVEDRADRISVYSQMEFESLPDDDLDLVIVIGGDGTVLDVSHRVEDTPMLAINSDPQRSVGYFCACGAEGAGAALDRFLAGASIRATLHRLAVYINGEKYPYPCMNDLLVVNQHPAMMSRYMLTAGELQEKHSSSGIWISTPAGSTAGIRSAGGAVLPLRAAMLQYLVREPYNPRGPGYLLHRGIRHISEGLHIRSLMSNGRIYVDGPYLEIDFDYGDELSIREAPPIQLLDVHPELRGR